MIDYFYGDESDLFAFFRIPRELFRNPLYKGMSAEAKILYGLLLDRNSLSQSNGWLDDQGRVYIYFSREEAMSLLNVGGESKISKLFAELRKADLIEEVRQGLGKPNIIYVGKFIHTQTQVVVQTGKNTAQNPHKSTELPKQEFRNSQNGSSETPKTGVQELSKWEANYTYDIQTLPERELHQSVSQSQKVDLTASTDRQTDGLTDLYQKVQIDLFTDKSLQQILKSIIKELYITNPSQTDNLALSHIDEALARFRHAEEEKHIKNPRGYFKKCLLSTIEELGLQNVGYEQPKQPQEVLQDREKKDDASVVASSFQLEPQKQQLPLETIEDNIRGLRHILSQSRVT